MPVPLSPRTLLRLVVLVALVRGQQDVWQQGQEGVLRRLTVPPGPLPPPLLACGRQQLNTFLVETLQHVASNGLLALMRHHDLIEALLPHCRHVCLVRNLRIRHPAAAVQPPQKGGLPPDPPATSDHRRAS